MSRVFAILLPVLLLVGAGCSPLPPKPAERALYQDLRQVVETRERSEWLVDYSEIERATPAALQSVCQVGSDDARDLSSWLDDQIRQQGGPAEEQYRDGVPLRKLREELSLERTRALLEHADGMRERCPFYLEPSDDFAGVQQTTSRFVILAESMGAASMSIQGNSVFTGAGGAGRLMPSWGINHRLLIGLGVEAGGAAGFTPLSGEENEPLQTRVQGGIPLLFRFSDLATIFDVELAATGISSPTSPDLEVGFRGSIAGGVSTVRVNKFLPYFTLMVGYQYFPWTEPQTHMITAGTRIGLAFDP